LEAKWLKTLENDNVRHNRPLADATLDKRHYVVL
jgi:hypothetical protein